jgi:hypothetical protein
MQASGLFQSLNSIDLLAGYGADWSDSGTSWLTIDQDRAGAAFSLATAILGPGQAKLVA